jgi:hypothetical protein
MMEKDRVAYILILFLLEWILQANTNTTLCCQIMFHQDSIVLPDYVPSGQHCAVRLCSIRTTLCCQTMFHQDSIVLSDYVPSGQHCAVDSVPTGKHCAIRICSNRKRREMLWLCSSPMVRLVGKQLIYGFNQD